MRPVVLVILDGWGWREERADNAIALAETPNFDRLWRESPHAFLRTSGADVGLPDGQMGNSEVGHLHIGAGRVVRQELARIGAAVADGSLAANPALSALIERARETGGRCHLMGLVSHGGVHSHADHGLALARIVAGAGVPVAVHAWTDGRDTPPESGRGFLRAFEAGLPEGARIATVSGRYYPMDRDRRWERVEKAWRAMAVGEGARAASADAAIAAAYADGTTDEFVRPACIGDHGGMRDGDVLLSFNFRADRVREILAALLDPAFDGFPRHRLPAFAAAAGMTRYSDALAPFLGVLFPREELRHVLGEVVAAAGGRQLRAAETEKYPHVTYFLNGGEERVFPGEDRILVPSPKVATYDLQPEMAAPELAARVAEAIAGGTYELAVVNFANPDMVGHTGSLPAAIRAVEAVDDALGRIAAAVQTASGALLVTADHGNAELMRDPETGGPHTAHTVNKVPVLLAGAGATALRDGTLADLAPTLLRLLALPQPAEMTGQALV